MKLSFIKKLLLITFIVITADTVYPKNKKS